jgi:hypothetical protein
MTEHSINYRSCLEIARALREQIDWVDVRERSADTPFGRAFFVIAEGLEVIPPNAAATDMAGAAPKREGRGRLPEP